MPLGDLIGRIATNLIEPRVRITQLMNDLGAAQLLRSTQATPHSVWVTEDQAPGKIAGYYVRHHIPIEHVIAEDGNTVVLQFTYNAQRYRISHATFTSTSANLRAIALLLESFSEFTRFGFMRWEEAFYPFLVDDKNIARTRQEWWSVLRFPPDATPSEIEKAYREQAKKHHPDHGGNHEDFLRVQSAYATAKKSQSKQR